MTHPAPDEPALLPPRGASADAVRARLAHAALGLSPRASDTQVGPLTLHPHQRHAAARLRYALHHYRTALLADDVGLGKTAVALAILRDTPDALVVAPATLRSHWTAALRAAGLTCRLLTTESLGNGSAPNAPPPPLIVVDEAHHFRNAATHRWRRLATLAADSRVLLLSATPVHNRPTDLATLFRLALGDHAQALDAPTLARLVVRRSANDVVAHPHADARPSTAREDRPTVAPTVWLDLHDSPAILDALRTLPPAAPLQDGTPSPNLDRYTLIRLWTSSDAALRAALQRRRARALTVRDAIHAGLTPTRADLRALTRGIATDPTTQQLALLTPPTTNATAEPGDRGDVRHGIEAYLAALQRVRDALRTTSGDDRRIAEIRAIRTRHPDAHVVAFSWSADTVRALYRALAPDGRVAMLTAAGGRIASGPLSRADTLARFAPLGQSRPQPSAIERITLLLTTDVLSEGLDLRDASVVVHLDLPWTPARLAQRTGRTVRPGAPTPTVHVYAFRPPPTAAADLRVVAHARAKRRAAQHTVGSSPLEDALTLHGDCAASARLRRSPAAALLARDRALERWSAACPPPRDDPRHRARDGMTAALRCGTTGYVAVISVPTGLGALRSPTLVAALGARPPTSAPAVVRRALGIVTRTTVTVDPPPACVRAARRALARWARHHIARADLLDRPSVVRDVGRPVPPHAHAALLARAARALHAATPVERASLAASATLLRDALVYPTSAQRLVAIRDAALPNASDADWLVAAARAATRTSPHSQPRAPRPGPTLHALVLLVE